MDEAQSPHGTMSEDSLLITLTETVQQLEGVRTVGGRRGRVVEGMLSPAEDEDERGGRSIDEEEEEKEREQKVLAVLRELSAFYSDRLSAWREAVRKCASMFNKSPAGGSDQQHTTGCNARQRRSSFCDTFVSIEEDIESIVDKLSTVITKLDAALLHLSTEAGPAVNAAPEESTHTHAPAQHEDVNNNLSSPEQCGWDGGDETHTRPDNEQTADCTVSTSTCNNEEEVKGQVSQAETEKDKEAIHDKSTSWIMLGSTGQLEDGHFDACFIRAHADAAKVLRCELADNLSCLMVTGSEELVSRVMKLRIQEGSTLRFPVSLAVPFCARYRGSYRDVAVKMVDEGRRASYITPVMTEGVYGGHRGSFAEVKVYALGLFAVVSCLKRENYTVPKRGLSLKLPMDSRICLNYLPGSFTGPVMAQTMIQPVDAILLAAVKSRNDAYHSVASTSPLLYLTHPTSQPLRRPLTLTLPCPPNPEKQRRAQAEDLQSASPHWDQPATHRVRVLGVKSKGMSNESLTVLGFRDEQWSVLDQVTVKNQQNGLVSFDVAENFDRLLVVRLLSLLQPCHLTSLAEELEDSVCRHAVTVVLQRRPDDPHTILVAAQPSRDLSWELNKLQAQGYSSLMGTSSEILMCEADQLLLCFSGNITSTVGCHNNNNEAAQHQITFHSQRRNLLQVQLTEVDSFGNYSSPHYKGTAIFYKVTRHQLEWRGDKAVLKDAKLLGDPVCKMSLTLPKKVKNINLPITARVKLCEETDSLSDSLLLWLSGELSEEEVALLVLSLRLRRSAVQLVKLRAGDSLSSQAFHLLSTWRRGLPAVPRQPKASQLAQCLAKSGRPDLARELLLRQAASTPSGQAR
ncbi:death domain-containing protein 1 [Parambassis ranga]|uniref:Death domain-containing protein 1 n=1 Tax=Parambassis ranga TaxID=210632 RepID=A0A6P7K8B8_9TELE|nr:death domain-containing protein 1 [Parambassis ranga]